IPGSTELSYKLDQYPNEINNPTRNIYTQAAAPPQPKDNIDIDSRVINHIKQELLKDLSNQNKLDGISGGFSHYNYEPMITPIPSQRRENMNIVEQIKQEVLKDLPNQNNQRDDAISITSDSTLNIDKEVISQLKAEALQEIKSELKQRLREEVESSLI
ncbi:hypothetical protein C1645_760411, partial [Glomus cerebriforme]